MSKTKPSDTRLVLYGAAALTSIALALRFLYVLLLPSGTWMRFVLWANEQPESIAWWHHVVAVIAGALTLFLGLVAFLFVLVFLGWIGTLVHEALS